MLAWAKKRLKGLAKEDLYRLMGKLVAGSKKLPIQELYSQYQLLLVEALRLKTTIKKHTNVIQHLIVMVTRVFGAPRIRR